MHETQAPSRNSEPRLARREIESRLGEIAHETARLIHRADFRWREELRDHVIAQLRAETESPEREERGAQPPQASSAFAFAALFGCSGLLLLLLLPPVGTIVVLLAFGAALWGTVGLFVAGVERRRAARVTAGH